MINGDTRPPAVHPRSSAVFSRKRPIIKRFITNLGKHSPLPIQYTFEWRTKGNGRTVSFALRISLHIPRLSTAHKCNHVHRRGALPLHLPSPGILSCALSSAHLCLPPSMFHTSSARCRSYSLSLCLCLSVSLFECDAFDINARHSTTRCCWCYIRKIGGWLYVSVYTSIDTNGWAKDERDAP